MSTHELISDPRELSPSTLWEETIWAHTSEESLVDHVRKPRLCAAALLPFANGKPDWSGFVKSIGWMFSAAEHYGVELVIVLNADTGYIFQLSEQEYAEVLRQFRAAFPMAKFIAGVTARGHEHDSAFRADRYWPLLEIAQSHENCEIMLMTSPRLAALEPEPCRDAYFAIAERLVRPALVHALEPAFAPWAKPFEPWLLWQLAQHAAFIGGKISTLDEPHFLYWAAMCQQLPFVPHSGDDFGIATAIKLGLPLLIGAAVTGAPLICAAKDMWLKNSSPHKRFPTGRGEFDTRVYKLFEALQSLEDQVFRWNAQGSASAYKHSTAHVLKLLGLIASTECHPRCQDLRDANESDRMREALQRAVRMAERLGIRGYESLTGTVP